MSVLADHIIGLTMMALLLLCSAFFSGTETALFSLSREQIKQLRAHGHQVDRLLSELSKNPVGMLVAILFGNLVVNILFFSISVVVMADFKGWAALAGVVALLLVILFGEILPKAVGLSFPFSMIRVNAVVMRGWYHLLGPVRRILEYMVRYFEPVDRYENQLNAEELKMLIDVTRHDATFGHQEKAIVEDIVNLPDIRLRELMVPRVDQLFRRTDALAGEVLRAAVEEEMELVPVYEGDEDNVVGVVEVRDLFVNTDPNRSVSDFVKPIHFVPETKRADAMLRDFLDNGLRMVGVVDEYGGLAGTVCLENLLEEVVGEFDAMEGPLIEQLGETTYRLQGRLAIREWRSLFIGFLPDETVRTLALDTVSGLVVSLLKRMPRKGDVVCVENLKFTVEAVRSNRIEAVILELSALGEGKAS